MAADSIIQSLRDFFLTCPYLGDNKINVDFLPEKGVEYSIDTTPATEIIKKYVNGDSERQYLFVLRSVNDYGSDTLQNIANSGTFEKVSSWFETQTDADSLPILPAGKTAKLIEAQSTGYLFTSTPEAGKYQIQCRLIYLQKG